MSIESMDGNLTANRGFFARVLDAAGLGWLVPKKAGSASGAFTSALVALCAKMAVADGVAVNAEWEAFERLIDAVPPESDRVRRLYDQAKQDTAGAQAYAERIAKMLAGDTQTKRDVIECLLYVACADGVIHPAEDKFVTDVAATFGMDAKEFRNIRSMFVQDDDNPYAILGLPPDVSSAVLKARYRKLAAENHPDILIAAGASPALIKAANSKLATINSAYEAILKERAESGKA